MTGRIIDIKTSWDSKKPVLSLEINEESVLRSLFDELIGYTNLSIDIKKYKEKRSLDANAYVWVIMTEIAEVMKSSKEEIYEEMLQRYGYIYQDDSGYITITVKSAVDMNKVNGHWKRYKDNGKFTSYLMIKGTSEYDTGEMSHFIDCVVWEAKELGIETLPPEKLERMMQEYGKKHTAK